METLRYDAAVIPTDARFHVEAHWEPLLGSSGSTLRSAGWGSQRFGRASDGRAVWFVSVGRDHGEEVEWLVGGVRDTRLLGFANGEITTLRRAALLHDLGTTAVPNSIWDKPGPLTRAEFDRVERQPMLTEPRKAKPRVEAPPASATPLRAPTCWQARTAGLPPRHSLTNALPRHQARSPLVQLANVAGILRA